MPNSSGSDRSHSTLPSGDSDLSSPFPLKTKMFPVAGSTAGDAHAIRCGGTSLVKRLYLCSQSRAPVSALNAISRSCIDAPDPAVFCRYRRSPKTTGEDRPP
jgi:hypothetical protein